MALLIPLPVFNLGDGVPATEFAVEKAIELWCGPVTFSDGMLLTEKSATQFEFLLYRRPSVGGATEAWDDDSKGWVAETLRPKPQIMAPDGDIWKTWLVGVGQANAPKFATDPVATFPRYFAKCFFAGKRGALSAPLTESPPSSLVQIFAAGSRQLGGFGMAPLPPGPAAMVEMFLGPDVDKRAVRVRQAGGGIFIELTANGARLVIDPAGAIELVPKPGQKVKIAHLEATGTVTP